MNQHLRTFIRKQQVQETEFIMNQAKEAGVLLPGQSLLVRIEFCQGPPAHSKRRRTRFYDRPITAEECGRAFGLQLSDLDRRVLGLLRQNNGGPVHSSQLALALGKDKFFSDDLTHLNYKLSKLRPPLRITTAARGRSTEDSYWRIAEVAKA